MRRVTILLTIFLLLSMHLVNIGVESFSVKRSILEKEIDGSTLLSKLNLDGVVCNFQKKIRSFYMNKADDDDGYWRFSFSPEDIGLEDDAFHRADASYLSHFTEWWYFDAVFDNGYSAQAGVRIMSLFDQDIVIFSRLDVYKDNRLVSHNYRMYFSEDFYASTSVPWVLINQKEVMRGYIDRDTGNWTYDISFEMGDISADLHFVGCTKGYKGVTPGGEWAVILPRADVTGELFVEGEEIKVRGVGYHDHNWEVTAEAALNFGWYWGKINTDTYTIVWADILTTWYWNQPLLVINKNNDGYQNIEQDDIHFTVGDLRLTNWMIVPHSFSIVVHTENFSLDVEMQTLGIHYTPILGSIMNYWRYHMKCTGFIIVGSRTELIDDVVIAEFLRFRPY